MSFFACGGNCPVDDQPHDWSGPTIQLKSVDECKNCEGQGEFSLDGAIFTCGTCEGQGGKEYVSGESASCAKCGLDAMSFDMMNAP